MGEQISQFEIAKPGTDSTPVATSNVNDPLPGEDGHRPFDLTTMRQVRVVDPSELTIIKGESGRLEFIAADQVDSRLAKVTEKAIYKKAPGGDLVEGYETDKGLVILSGKGNYLVGKAQEDNYRKV